MVQPPSEAVWSYSLPLKGALKKEKSQLHHKAFLGRFVSTNASGRNADHTRDRLSLCRTHTIPQVK